MKKRMKKSLAMMMAAAMMTASLASCGKKSGGETTPAPAGETTAKTAGETEGNQAQGSQESAPAGGYADYSQGFPERVTIEIPVYDRAFEGWKPTDNYYTRWIQSEFGDRYNIEVKFISVGRSTEVQDFMQMIAAGNAPDIIFHYNMPQAVNYYNEGAMQKLDLDEIAFYAPDYYGRLKDTISQYGRLDDEHVFVFAERNAIYDHVIAVIRQDWLDAVGMESPTNLAELEAVGKAWKEAGLGKITATSTPTLGLLTKDFTFSYPYLSEAPKSEYPQYLDLDIAPFTWGPVKSYLANNNRLYNEGLLDPEFYLNKEPNDVKADFISGNTGVYTFTINRNTDVINSLLANDPNAKLSTMKQGAFSPAGVTNYYQYPPYGMIMGINNQSSDLERIAVWMYLNWMIQPENLMYLQNGIEGETYTLDENGVAIANPDYQGEAKLSNNMNKDYWCMVQEVVDYGDEDKNFQAALNNYGPPGYEYLVEDNHKYYLENKANGVISPIFTKTLESSSDYAADLNAMWQQFYVDCITCKPEEFEAKYEKYCQEYLDSGYQEVLDEKKGLIEAGDYIPGTE